MPFPILDLPAKLERKPARFKGTNIEMLVSSLLSLLAAFVLSHEAWLLAGNPNAVFSCDINTKISCGTVALSWQAHLLGFPNAYLGLIFEPIVITLAVAMLAGLRFPRWMMLTAQGIYTIAVFFAYWLFLQAYFVIGALCPWCLLVTVATTLVFTSMTRINILDNNFGFNQRMYSRLHYWMKLGADTWLGIIIIAVIAAMVIFKYV